MASYRLCCLLIFIALTTLADDVKPEPISEYDQFIRGYASNSHAAFILVVTTITGDRELTKDELAGLEPDARALKILNQQEQLASSVSIVSSAWQVEYVENTNMGHKGFSGNTIPEKDRKQLTELISNLPDDGKKLPPADRKVVIDARIDNNHRSTRVYDRAQLPDKIVELLRLGAGAVCSWCPRIASTAVIQSEKGASDYGAFCAFPSGTRILSASEHGPLKIWGASTHQLLREVNVLPNDSIKGVVLSPDGLLAAIQSTTDCYVFETTSWKMVQHIPGPSTPGVYHCLRNLEFSADGSTLMMQSTEPKVYTFETKLWNSVSLPPSLPVDAFLLSQTHKSKRALIASKDHKMELWDMDSRKRYAVLNEDAVSERVAFSPDESMVVVSPGYSTSGAPIRIWNMETGTLVQELRPFDARRAESVDSLIWSPDGKYVLGAVRPGSFFDTRYICVWSVSSGRQRATLEMSNSLDSADGIKDLGPVRGLALLDSGRILAAGDRWGKIHFWNLNSALKTIHEFEASLSGQPEKSP